MVDIIAPVTDYPPASLLTNQGDLYKRGAAVVERFPCGTADRPLKVNNYGNNLIYGRSVQELNTKGQLWKDNGSNTIRFPVGTANQAIQVNAAGDDLEFVNRGNLLTTQGDLMKHNGSVAARLPLGLARTILRVNAGGTDIGYEKPGKFLFEDERSAKNAGMVGITSGEIQLVPLDLGTVTANGRYFIQGTCVCQKGGITGRTCLIIRKASGTGTCQFMHDQSAIEHSVIHVGNEIWDGFLSCIVKITGSGTLVMELAGFSSGSDSQVNAGYAQVYCHMMKVF